MYYSGLIIAFRFTPVEMIGGSDDDLLEVYGLKVGLE